jgi:hypothetical protein
VIQVRRHSGELCEPEHSKCCQVDSKMPMNCTMPKKDKKGGRGSLEQFPRPKILGRQHFSYRLEVIGEYVKEHLLVECSENNGSNTNSSRVSHSKFHPNYSKNHGPVTEASLSPSAWQCDLRCSWRVAWKRVPAAAHWRIAAARAKRRSPLRCHCGVWSLGIHGFGTFLRSSDL